MLALISALVCSACAAAPTTSIQKSTGASLPTELSEPVDSTHVSAISSTVPTLRASSATPPVPAHASTSHTSDVSSPTPPVPEHASTSPTPKVSSPTPPVPGHASIGAPTAFTRLNSTDMVTLGPGSSLIAPAPTIELGQISVAKQLERLAQADPGIPGWESNAEDIRLYIGRYRGSLGDLQPDALYVYLRIARGPQCTFNMLTPGTGGTQSDVRLTTQTVPCTIGVILALNGKTTYTYQGAP